MVNKKWSEIAERFPNKHFLCVDARRSTDVSSNVKDSSDITEVWYVFEVEDNGCGVTLEDLQVMFNAYKQGNHLICNSIIFVQL